MLMKIIIKSNNIKFAHDIMRSEKIWLQNYIYHFLTLQIKNTGFEQLNYDFSSFFSSPFQT